MAGVLAELANFIAKAAAIAIVCGVFTRGINIFVRAVSGKEDII